MCVLIFQAWVRADLSVGSVTTAGSALRGSPPSSCVQTDAVKIDRSVLNLNLFTFRYNYTFQVNKFWVNGVSGQECPIFFFFYKLHQISSLPFQVSSESYHVWLSWECLQVLNGGHVSLDGSSFYSQTSWCCVKSANHSKAYYTVSQTGVRKPPGVCELTKS